MALDSDTFEWYDLLEGHGNALTAPLPCWPLAAIQGSLLRWLRCSCGCTFLVAGLLQARQAVEAGKVREILDPRMPSREEDCPTSVVEAFATLACACVAATRKDRPDMARVAALLTELKHMPEGASVDVSIHSASKSLGKKVAPLTTSEMP